MNSQNPISRRRFAVCGGAALATWLLPGGAARAAGTSSFQLGIISDVHQDVIPDAGDRLKVFLAEAEKEKADAIIEMGDFCIPKPENRAFANLFEAFPRPKYHVIGNHEMDEGYTREQVVAFHKLPGRYYTMDLGPVMGIVLDGNDRPADHNGGYPSHIAEDQLTWLEGELAEAGKTVFIFSHQSLERPNCIRSQEKARAIISAARFADGTRKVAACLNGHFHIDHAREIDGIPYIHINSASYYWVGANFQRRRFSEDIHRRYPDLAMTAPYRDALFTFLEINPAAGTFSLSARATEWVGESPREMGQLYPGLEADWVQARQSARGGNWKKA
jgi:hypothetical protein